MITGKTTFCYLQVLKLVTAGILLPAFIVGILCGCSVLSKTETKKPTVKEIDEKIKQAVDLSNFKVGNFVKLKQLYGITREEIEEFALYRASSNIKADEILLIKVKAANSVNGVKEKILKRAEKQAASFKDYLPEEHFKIQKKEIIVKNNYILFAVSKDAQKIADVFEKCF